MLTFKYFEKLKSLTNGKVKIKFCKAVQCSYLDNKLLEKALFLF